MVLDQCRYIIKCSASYYSYTNNTKSTHIKYNNKDTKYKPTEPNHLCIDKKKKLMTYMEHKTSQERNRVLQQNCQMYYPIDE